MNGIDLKLFRFDGDLRNDIFEWLSHDRLYVRLVVGFHGLDS